MPINLAEGTVVSSFATLESGLVRRDGSLSVAILGFGYELDGIRSKYAGAVNQSITDDSWNWVYLDWDGSLNINTTGFPDTTHIRLARVYAQDGAITTIFDERVFLGAAIDKNIGKDTEEGEDSTQDTNWVQKLRVSKNLKTGTYKIHWYCEIRHSNNDTSERVETRVEVNDTTEIGYSPWLYNLYKDTSGYAIKDLNEGSYTFDLDYRVQGGNTGYIRRARLHVERIA